MEAGVDTYMTQETADALELSGHRLKVIKPLKSFNVGRWKIMAFETVHDADGAVGFLIYHHSGIKLLYVTDSCYVPYRFSGLTHIMIECNYALDILDEKIADGRVDISLRNRIIRNHMSLETVLKMLSANDLSRVNKIVLLHLSDGNSDQQQFKREVEELTGKEVCIA